MIRIPTALLLLGAAMAAAAPASVAAQSMAPSMLVQTTPTYTVILEVGAPAHMVSPGMMGSSSMGSSSMMDSSAEVMVGMVGMPMAGTDTNMSSSTQSSMASNTSDMADQGMAVNHHLEVHVTDNSSGAVVNSVTPVIRIRDKATGVSRDLNDVMAMYSAHMGPSDFHYGQNVWLPDGQYDITVMLGTQSAQFQGVTVSGGMEPMMGMGG